MPTTAQLLGVDPALSARLSLGPATPADILIDARANAEAAIQAARDFAAQAHPGQDKLIVTLLPHHDPRDWPQAEHAARIWAFTRWAALAWAPRRIRVNTIGLGISPMGPDQPMEASGQAAGPAPATPASPEDVAATILAMWRLPSMTGQLIRLGA